MSKELQFVQRNVVSLHAITVLAALLLLAPKVFSSEVSGAQTKDKQAVQVIQDCLNAIGGFDDVKKTPALEIQWQEERGNASLPEKHRFVFDLRSARGFRQTHRYDFFERQFLETVKQVCVGDREALWSKGKFVRQTADGRRVLGSMREHCLPLMLLDLLESRNQLRLGTSERSGEHTVEVLADERVWMKMYFDEKTHLLKSRHIRFSEDTLKHWPRLKNDPYHTYDYLEYKLVEGHKLPHKVSEYEPMAGARPTYTLTSFSKLKAVPKHHFDLP